MRHISAEVFEANRARLMGIAYGMLGSVMDAEDVVQDAYLRWSRVDAAQIDSPAAYLTTVTTRLAIDRLRSASRRRETYVGPWLPEPLVATDDHDPADMVAKAEQLSVALLTALERLNPVERAVLLLRQVFDLDYGEIADVVDKSPVNCRKIASRARERAGDLDRPSRVDSAQEAQLLGRYADAIARLDAQALAEIFAEDVVLWSDGGGKVRAARRLLFGARRVARHLVGVAPQTPDDAEVSVVRINGEPGFMARTDGGLYGLVSFEIEQGLITAVHAYLNPDKLQHLEAG